MKRTVLLSLAGIAAVVAALVVFDVINFETDRIDRWATIFSLGAAALLVWLASREQRDDALQDGALPSSAPAGPNQEAGATQRTAAADDPIIDLVAIEPDPITIDAVDVELQEMIDEDQIHEISALVEDGPASSRPGSSNAEQPRTADEAKAQAADHGVIRLSGDEGEPLARLEIRLADHDDVSLARVVKESEAVVIAEMVRSGQLSSEGDLTDRDIASMVYLAYTGEEMLAELRLRKTLDQPGDVAVTGKDLAPLKNIE